jgi:hypothetical protein
VIKQLAVVTFAVALAALALWFVLDTRAEDDRCAGLNPVQSELRDCR